MSSLAVPRCIAHLASRRYDDLSKGEPQLQHLVNQRLWTVINRLQDRLDSVDLLDFLTSDVVGILRGHLQTVRRYPADRLPGHPCQASPAAELHYLRR